MQPVHIDITEIVRKRGRQPVLSRDHVPEVGEDVEGDPVLVTPCLRVLRELRRERNERGTSVGDLREEFLESNLLKTAVRSPPTAEEAQDGRPTLDQRRESNRISVQIGTSEVRGAVSNTWHALEDIGRCKILRRAVHDLRPVRVASCSLLRLER